MNISIIVPTLNEELLIAGFLQRLMRWPKLTEIIVVDGGSNDRTQEILRSISHPALRVFQEPGLRGRARQMNFGAQMAGGDVLLFLHVDCELPEAALLQIEKAVMDTSVIGGGFYKKYAEENTALKFYRGLMNVIRTKWMRNLVGTNAIFIRRKVFFELGQYPDIPLLEDVILCDRMKSNGSLAFLKPHVIVSSRRYYHAGVWKRMWIALKILYFFRIRHMAPEKLKEIYLAEIRR